MKSRDLTVKGVAIKSQAGLNSYKVSVKVMSARRMK